MDETRFTEKMKTLEEERYSWQLSFHTRPSKNKLKAYFSSYKDLSILLRTFQISRFFWGLYLLFFKEETFSPCILYLIFDSRRTI